ncbi:hypothetical protein [Haloarchaeobius sp. DFWS5]|uniref:hypothetical protein n=1 Tax=Haloarchaeobius sp. DFWS5 TaxID=3446114 RepID=UPI003EB82187
MALTALKPYVLRYTLLVGPVFAAVVLGVSVAAGAPLTGVAFFFGGAMLVAFPTAFATSDAGLDSAGASVSGGFDVTNPWSVQPKGGLSSRFGVAFCCLGAGLTSIGVFLVTSGVFG